MSTKPKRQILTGIRRGLGRSIVHRRPRCERRSHLDLSTDGEATMRKHGAEVLCTAGAAKPDSGEPNNVSCWRSSTLCGTFGERRHGRAAGKRMAGERQFGEKK